MIFKYFLTFAHAWAAAILVARDFELPSSQSARIIEVRNLTELQNKFSKALSEPTEDFVFHVENTNTFVAQKNNDYWDIEENLDGLSAAGFRKKKSKGDKNEISWIEFGFQKLYIVDSATRIPVSHCHSEVNGQGGALNIQSTIGLGQSLTGSFGVSPNIVAISLSLTGSVTLELSESVTNAVACDVKHGEVVQLFLVGSQFIYYTPRMRELTYDRKKKSWRKLPKFSTQKQRRAVVRGGLGEWACGSSTVIPLQCSYVSHRITDL